MHAAECMDLLNEVEARVPVDTWRVAGLHVWPLVRESLWWHLNDLYGPARVRGGRLARRLRQLGPLAGGWSRFVTASVSDRAHQASLRAHADVVAFGDNVSRVWLDGAWYDRLCEPLLEAFEELGKTSLELEPYHLYRTPRHRSSRWVQPALDRDWIRSRLRPGSSLPAAELEGYDEMGRVLSSRNIDTSPFSSATLRRQALLVRLVADRLGRVLERVGPRIGLVVDYGSASMAFNQACRERGIPSLEIQHGQEGDLHWAYARWTRLPPGGYGLLPSTYWTWSPSEAGVINRWATAGSGHGAIVGGNPWLEQWRHDTSPVVRGYDEMVARLLSEAGGDVNVLVTLQSTMTGPAQVGPLMAAVEASPPSWRWWVRRHPVMDEEERRRVARLFGPLAGRAEVEQSSELPLPALLRHVDVHVTINSSAVLEAQAFGVPSVVLDPDAHELYPEQAASGWIALARGPSEILDRIAQQRERSAALAPPTPVTAPPSAVLARLLGS